MEIKLSTCNSEIGVEALELATSRVDGATVNPAKMDGTFVADNEDAVWNVWRELNKLADTAETDEAKEIASNMANEINATFDTSEL